MKRLILYLIILAISIWIGIKIFHNPGYVLITNQEWVIETTLWFAVVASLLGLVLIYFLVRLLVKTFHIPESVHKWRLRNRFDKSLKRLASATDNFLQGKWRDAEKQFLKSTKATNLALFGYLGAAKTAYNRKSFGRGNHYLKRAKNNYPSMDLSLDIAAAKLQLEHGLHIQALNNLLKLYESHPKHRYILELLANCYLQLNDWDNLYKLLPKIKSEKLFASEKLMYIEKEIYLQRAKHTINNYETTTEWWKNIAKELHKDPEILAVYAYYLNEFGHSNEAEKLLRNYLNNNWHEQLFEQYVRINAQNPAKQNAFAEKLLQTHPESSVILRCMGKLSIKNQLWGHAKDYLEKSLKLEKSKESYCLLGYVMEKLGHTQAALDNYRKGCN